MTPKPHTLRRLDCPQAGPLVHLLGPAGEGWVRVQSVKLKATFETRESRLHKPLN